MLGDLLGNIVENEDRYEAAKMRALRTLDQGFHLGGKIDWKREDLYDR
jgi:hypothetical protein